MEEAEYRQRSPDSSSGSVGISRHSTSAGSPVASGAAPLSCPQCPSVLPNQNSLAAHLLTDHRMRFVLAQQQQQQLPQQQLNSTASSVSTSPVQLLDDNGAAVTAAAAIAAAAAAGGGANGNKVTTVCPVCRLHVDDLSRHFAIAHTSPQTPPEQHSNDEGASAAATAAAAMALAAAAATRAAMASSGGGTPPAATAASAPPAVQLPNTPLPANRLTASDLQQKLLILKEETKVHVNNFHSNMQLQQGSNKRKFVPRKIKVESEPSTPLPAAAAAGLATFAPHPHHPHHVPHHHQSQIKEELPDEMEDGHGAINLSVRDSETNNNSSASSLATLEDLEEQRKARRRKQTQVPDQNKDQRYWARRLKNNQAAKRSRDMRIQREKIIFDENAKLEATNKELTREKDRLTTENKELQLKMGFILEENERLKSIIQSLESQQQQPVPTAL